MSSTRVFAFRTLTSEAHCDCGWTGRRRLLRGLAIHDALVHCWVTGCTPADDLVVVDA